MMLVELSRVDLMHLCTSITGKISGDLKDNKYKGTALIRKDFINGFFWRLQDKWLEAATDLELFDFYHYHQPDIKIHNLNPTGNATLF